MDVTIENEVIERKLISKYIENYGQDFGPYRWIFEPYSCTEDKMSLQICLSLFCLFLF